MSPNPVGWNNRVFVHALGVGVFSIAGLLLGCSSAPRPAPRPASAESPARLVPTAVFMGEPGRPYQELGTVRTWQAFPTTLDESYSEREFSQRCKKAFYEASGKLLRIAQENGGDAVIQVKSVVFLADGRMEYHPRPECAEDGQEGEALVQGVAVRFTGAAPAAKPPGVKKKPVAPK